MIFGAVLASAGLWLSAETQAQDQPVTLPRDQVERIVREYLMREPEVIYEAIQELQKRREMAEADRQKQVISARQDQIFKSELDPVVGDPNGDVTLVEFFDYHCGYCRSMVAGLRDLVETDKKLRFVFKEFPVLGPDSVLAARAALAARQQAPEKYYDFHLALMASQDLSLETIKQVASDAGLDVDQLQADMESEPVKQAIDANQALAQDLGINGTPSFIIGDKLIPGAIDIKQLAALIDQHRNATN
jgi:protein-disulfide isomerase